MHASAPLPITAAGVEALAEMRRRDAQFRELTAALPRWTPPHLIHARADAAFVPAGRAFAPAIERKDAGRARAHLHLPLEVKFAKDSDDTMTFSGYGAVFDNVDSYGDVIVKGAFVDTLARAKTANDWPAMLLNHGGWGVTSDDQVPIGIWTAMEEDDIGLRVEGKFADTARGREAYALLKMTPRPAINGLSIGYIAKEWEMRSRPEEPRRTLKKVDLLEVSLVTFPANPKARVQGVKSGLTVRDAERALRDVGFSQTEAKAILAEGFKAAQRDADDGDALDAFNRMTVANAVNRR